MEKHRIGSTPSAPPEKEVCGRARRCLKSATRFTNSFNIWGTICIQPFTPTATRETSSLLIKLSHCVGRTLLSAAVGIDFAGVSGVLIAFQVRFLKLG